MVQQAGPRVLVVSRNPSISLGLSTCYDIHEVGPERTDEWLRAAHGADAVVLGVGDPAAARAALIRLREAGSDLPIVAVASGAAGWDRLEAHAFPNVDVLPLPITRDSLVASVRRVLRGTAEPVITVDRAPEREPDKTTVVDLSVAEPAPLSGAPAVIDAEEINVDYSPPEQVAEPCSAQIEVETAVLHSDGDLPLAAQVIAAELAERIDATAVAVLVPDGADWAVAGHVGLREREQRLRVPATAWLMTEALQRERALLIPDTDVYRLQLRGTPLSSKPYLVVVPLPALSALLIAAREDQPFGESHLTAALSLVNEATELLRGEKPS